MPRISRVAFCINSRGGELGGDYIRFPRTDSQLRLAELNGSVISGQFERREDCLGLLCASVPSRNMDSSVGRTHSVICVGGPGGNMSQGVSHSFGPRIRDRKVLSGRPRLSVAMRRVNDKCLHRLKVRRVIQVQMTRRNQRLRVDSAVYLDQTSTRPDKRLRGPCVCQIRRDR